MLLEKKLVEFNRKVIEEAKSEQKDANFNESEKKIVNNSEPGDSSFKVFTHSGSFSCEHSVFIGWIVLQEKRVDVFDDSSQPPKPPEDNTEFERQQDQYPLTSHVRVKVLKSSKVRTLDYNISHN